MKPKPGAPDRQHPSYRPRGNGNFLVDLGMGDPRAPEAGFCEVIFPEFWLDEDAEVQPPPQGALAPPRNPYLILRRAATGALDLYHWWQQAREGKAPKRRIVTIELLAEDGVTVVMRWRFHEVRPVGLAYSPLQAQEPGLLFETLTLAFGRVEMG